MTLSMYQASVPVFIRVLDNLSKILEKGAAHAEAHKLDLVNAKLHDTMFPLTRQVQIASDAVKGGGARLAGVELPSFPDTETSFAGLQERVAKTIAFLRTLKAEQIDGSEDKVIALKVGGTDLEFKGQTYLLNFVLPNLYFHVTTAYGILRNQGVELGKMDYLGSPT